MSSTTDPFGPRDALQLVELVSANPLAWVVSPSGPYATPLPLRPILGADGALVALHGHFARTNPQVAALQAAPRALLLFMGPHGYISPSWMADRTQAPTWIYAGVRIVADVELQDTADQADASLGELTEAMEGGREKAWRASEMGDRYARLRRGVVPFLARVVEIEGRIKAGQTERDDVLVDIMDGLARTGRLDLHDLVQAMNADRLRKPDDGDGS